MAINSKLTRAQLRDVVRRELADTNSRWWTDAELNIFIEDWQNRVQSQAELVWGSATLTETGSSTFTLTNLGTDIHRIDAVYYNGVRLSYRTKEDLELLDRSWRAYGTTTSPSVVYQENFDSFTVWPPAASTAVGTIVVEYPKTLTFAADTSTHELPAWTKYTVKNYAGFRAFVHRGPNYSPDRAERYKKAFYAQLAGITKTRRSYLPKRGVVLRPGASDYEIDILNPYSNITEFTIPSNTIDMFRFYDEAPTGTIDGTNTSFVLTTAPNPAASLELSLDGIELKSTTHYTLSSNVITFVAPFQPASGQRLIAHYRELIV